MSSIYDDTPIMPDVIAETVSREAAVIAGRNDLPGLEEWLAARSERIYKANKRFRQKIQGAGNSGRDWLYVFMRHWAASWLFDQGICGRSKIPHEFANGHSSIERATNP